MREFDSGQVSLRRRVNFTVQRADYRRGCRTRADKPGAVSDLAVKEVGRSSVTVRWSEPRDDGGADVSAYVLEKREAGRRMWQAVQTVPRDVTQLEAAGLYEGNQYEFRVAAENAVGVGEFAELRDAVVPRSQFGE